LAALILLGLAALVKHPRNAPNVEAPPTPGLPRVTRPPAPVLLAPRRALTRGPNVQRRHDVLLTAVSAPGTTLAVVFETSALTHSPLGQLLLDCLAALDEPEDGPSLELGKLRAQGFDPLQDLDRVAFVDHNVMASGDFSRVNWDTLLASTTAEPHGTQGQLRSAHTGAVGAEGPVLATWGTELVVMAPTRAAAMATLDRIEGRGPTEALLGEDQAYGDVYGVLTGAALTSAFGPPNTLLSAQVQSAARRVEFHLDATHDVDLVATVTGDDSGHLQDLGRALGSALALQRSQAVTAGDLVTAALLKSAQVTTRGSTVELEVGVPFEVVRELLASCGREAAAEKGR
jgi:hypothetical protein